MIHLQIFQMDSFISQRKKKLIFVVKIYVPTKNFSERNITKLLLFQLLIF